MAEQKIISTTKGNDKTCMDRREFLAAAGSAAILSHATLTQAAMAAPSV